MRSPHRNIVTPNRGGPRDDRHYLARRDDALRRERSCQSPTNRAGADDGLSARRPFDADARRPSPVVGPCRLDIRQSHAVWTRRGLRALSAQLRARFRDARDGAGGCHLPGHFRGVTTVVAKLFNIVKPHLAVFGEKDFQQLRAIQKMVRDLNFDVEIVPVPIVREEDGLAMSSRNAYLSPTERRDALALSLAIRAAREKHSADPCCAEEIVFAATRVLKRMEGVEIEYVEAVDAETLARHPSLDRPILVAIAARVGKTRLIDNLVLQP